MTIKHANRLVKKLVGEDDFHDVEDVLASYYDLAQRQIATTVAPIYKTCTVKAGVKAQLPSDIYRLKSVGAGYTRLDKNHIIIDGKGDVTVTYYAYPKRIYDDSTDSTEFEIDKEAQAALPYYAAAQTVLADSDMRRYNAFMDMYNGILTNIAAAANDSTVIRVVKTEELR